MNDPAHNPPTVTVIVPCYNEQHTIRLLLEALHAQTYPRGRMEVVIADGRSSDRTREQIRAFQIEKPDLAVRVVDNPQRIIPAGLNRAIEAARGEILVRLDGHSAPRPDYVACCVAALEQGLGDNVGGLWEIRPRDESAQARAIAAAAAHPLGVGDARYRVGGQAQPADTVPFGAFRRSLVERVGPFDESLLTNEDYEFNARVRQAGGVVWFDPSIRSTYFAAGSLRALARQYWRYGYWKARMLRLHPSTLRWRQALPPLFVAGLAGLGLLSLVVPAAGWLLLAAVSAYVVALLAAGLLAAIQQRDAALLVYLPLAIGAMHLSWGSAFVWSILSSVIAKDVHTETRA